MSEPTGQSRIGVTGLAVMGANLARNIARQGTPTAVHNRTTAKTTEFMDDYGDEGPFTGCETTEEFVAALETPAADHRDGQGRAPVDAVIEELTPLLDEGDIIIDAGNSHFPDTERRTEECAAQRHPLHRRRRVRRRGGRAARAEHHARRRPARPTPRWRTIFTAIAAAGRRHAVLHVRRPRRRRATT